MPEKKKVKIVEDGEEKNVQAKLKPSLSDETKELLSLRKERKMKQPKFRRQEWFRYKRVGTSWRKPRGLHSKARTNLKYRPPKARVGYGGPSEVKGFHPSGFQEVMVHNPRDLDNIDPSTQAARIGHSVGTRKRMDIVDKARKMKIRVLNGGV